MNQRKKFKKLLKMFSSFLTSFTSLFLVRQNSYQYDKNFLSTFEFCAKDNIILVNAGSS